MLETALVLPILMALTCGIVEYGYFFYVHHSVQGAARQGARAGSVDGGTNTDIHNAVAMAMNSSSLSQTRTGYVVNITNGSNAPITAESATTGQSIAVEIEIDWSNVSLINMAPFLQGTIFPEKVHGSTVMRKEG